MNSANRDGSVAVALFNRGETPVEVATTWAALKLSGNRRIRDLWRQTDLPNSDSKLEKIVSPHGAELFKISNP